MLREGFLHGLAPLKGADLRRLLLGLHPVLGRVFHKLPKLQFQLVEQLGAALCAAAILVALEQRDLKLEASDHRFGGRDHRACPCQIGFSRRGALFRSRKRGAQFIKFRVGLGHGKSLPHPPIKDQ